MLERRRPILRASANSSRASWQTLVGVRCGKQRLFSRAVHDICVQFSRGRMFVRTMFGEIASGKKVFGIGTGCESVHLDDCPGTL